MPKKQFAKTKGQFENGAWQCNCIPRLPAVRFQSNKGKPENKGRWFYTCQKGPSDQTKCDFFLWQEDAQPRELAALRNNSRTEPGSTAHSPIKKESKTSPHPPCPADIDQSRKRHRQSFEEPNSYGDEFDFDREDNAVYNDLDQTLLAAETPTKATRTTLFTTPRRRLDFDHTSTSHIISTPQTGPRIFRDPFSTPGSRSPELESVTQEPTPTSSFRGTPSRSRNKGSSGSKDLAQNVLEWIKMENVHLNKDAEASLMRILNTHAKIAEGNRRGRDVLRLELKAKEAKVASLEKHLDTLKAELEANEAARRFQQWQDEQGTD
ncbi:hypothetical protein BU24DRAFT_424077 [Aaosphaeria arxii CBS 175.79]|uniref:GRF-type domain-containing protein n=1 Tax=Aaosphaeria arxii CBS 175.79 TaxID=1450172 RepID=A0A6A5XIZ0_9PLEO|nr:uncharacterized protein BU24DRAFT_424077 [Aaosphaeria arxii CBS 175.79]KAF2013092.1 hypothetical protein BU24DRAFT_424077 [Aaosphaeria arxii CBS 175.79]